MSWVLPLARPSTFLGYRRPDGWVGVRNHLAVLPSVFCANLVAERIADRVAGAVALPHSAGCSQFGPDYELTRRVLLALGTHPNVGAVLVVGLGCEMVEVDPLVGEMASIGRSVASLTIQEAGGTLAAIASGVELAEPLARELSGRKREPCSLDGLILATECGGTDATSGIAANPVVGAVADRVLAMGGSMILGESSELMGAEHILARRCVDLEVAGRIGDFVREAEARALGMGVDLRGTQPSPGNIAGGVTTVEEKALGDIRKAGTGAIRGGLAYGERPAGAGLHVMDTAAHDVESVTGMVAGGAQAVLFTTGRGNPVGNPVAPVIKITGNPRTYAHMRDDMDFSAGPIVEGKATVDEMGERLFQLLLDVLSGRLTRSEVLGHRELMIQRLAPSA